jgi:hypothetical protein
MNVINSHEGIPLKRAIAARQAYLDGLYIIRLVIVELFFTNLFIIIDLVDIHWIRNIRRRCRRRRNRI